MRHIALDFSGRVSLKVRASWILLGVGIASLMLTAGQYIWLKTRISKAEVAYQVLQRHLASRSPSLVPGPEIEKQRASAQYAGKVGLALAVPWDELFQSIERIAGDNVTLLDLEADPDKEGIQFLGEARDLAGMTDYLWKLQNLSGLEDAYIVSHQEQTQDSERSVRFQGKAKWLKRTGPEAPAPTRLRQDSKSSRPTASAPASR